MTEEDGEHDEWCSMDPKTPVTLMLGNAAVLASVFLKFEQASLVNARGQCNMPGVSKKQKEALMSAADALSGISVRLNAAIELASEPVIIIPH